MNFLKIGLKVFCLFAYCLCSFAQTTIVPTDFPSIQEAIDAAGNGDTILVDRGIYKENLVINQKNILLTSQYFYTGDPMDILETEIDGSAAVDMNQASTIRINGGNASCRVHGFTISGGEGSLYTVSPGYTYLEGGGLFISNSNATIDFNVITRNNVYRKGNNFLNSGGAGIHTSRGNPTIRNNVITCNYASYGSAIISNFSNLQFFNNLVFNNISRPFEVGTAFGATVFLVGGNSQVINNTIVNNISKGNSISTSGKGGGMLQWLGACNVRNNVFYNNHQESGQDIFIYNTNSVTVAYNLLKNWSGGTGNLEAEPQLAANSFLPLPNSAVIDKGDPSSQCFLPPEALPTI